MTAATRAVAAIVGSAFDEALLARLDLEPRDIETSWGRFQLHHARAIERPDGLEAWVSFRHGLPHRFLPNQIPYRAQAAALAALGTGALLVTSSVGVLDPDIPLHRAMLVSDIIMLENRLPDGTAATLFERPRPGQGHLVLREGLLSSALTEQLRALEVDLADASPVFGWVGGPRTKTAAENRAWALLGAQVNSMTLAPELVLANELQIPTTAVVVGHKRSADQGEGPSDADEVGESLRAGRDALEEVVVAFLERATPVPFGNHIYRFADPPPEAATTTRSSPATGEAVATPPSPPPAPATLDPVAHVRRRLPDREAAGPSSRLEGGLLNHVWRVRGEPSSVIVKHAPPFVATAPEIALDPGRIVIETTCLRELGPGGRLSAVCGDGVRPPALLDFDADAHVAVIEDLGPLPDLAAALAAGDGDAGALGGSLGRFIGRLHGMSLSDPLLAVDLENDAVQRTRLEVQYRAIGDILGAEGVADGDSLGARAVDLGERLLAPGACAIMGDLWPASVLVTAKGRLRVIDWELAHWGSPAQDVGHLAAHLFMQGHRSDDPDATARFETAATAFLEGYRAVLGGAIRMLWSEATIADAAVHAGCEILVRAAGPFQAGSLYDGLEADATPRREAVARAAALLRDAAAEGRALLAALTS